MEEKIVIGVVTKNQNVLIVKRKQKEGDLFWQFPGGGVEQGETEEQAVLRELKEETGINCIVNECLGNRTHPSSKKDISYWACDYINGDIFVNDDDLDMAVWVSIDKVLDYFTTPVFQPILDYLGIG